jgi:hypothetical protein
MKNFFNAIGVADMEKVHSAMIAWILDNENDTTFSANQGGLFSTFPIAERSKLLCGMFGLLPVRQFKSIKTHVEWNDIDIMIETEEGNGQKEIWVIENKLKSQEHKSNVSSDEKQKWNINADEIWQTEKYEHIICDNFPNDSHHYLLLSLGGDVANSSSGYWESYTYSKLQKMLSNMNPKSFVLIKEYTDAISKMTKELKTFLNSGNNISKYPHVFQKLTKSKASNANITPEEKYIVENRLETIFQKQFLAMIVNNYISTNPLIVRYDERNGIAMFIEPIKDIGDYSLSIEFQGGTFKVVLLHKDYIKSNSYVYTKPLYDKNGKVYPLFNQLVKNEWRKAQAKNLPTGKAKPRIALDKSMGGKWYCNLQNNNFLTIYKEAKDIANQIINSIPSIP